MTGQRTDRPPAAIGAVVLVGLVVLAVGLVAAVMLARNTPAAAEVTATAVPGSYAYAQVREAPPLDLIDQNGDPFDLAAFRGRPVLVYFGYTHCPDVCPTSIGIINETLAATGPGPRAVFVSIDPDRDDVAAMKSYLRYLPAGYVGLSGTPEAIRRAADGWGVQYAKIDTGSAGGYAMGHSSEVYLVDGLGQLRAAFPFGTESPPITAAVRELLAEIPPPSEPPATPFTAAATPAPSSPPTGAPEATAPATAAPATAAPATAAPPPASPGTGAGLALYPRLITTSIWAGGASPVILTIRDAAGYPLDGTASVRVRVASPDGTPAGPDVEAVPVSIEQGSAVSFVATVDVPTPGPWRLDLTDANGAAASLDITALDPGSTPQLGAAAPRIATPTLADVGGNAAAISTVREPDLRLSETSTAQATAAGKPYVLLIDSSQFETTPACGRALLIVQNLVDRWPGVKFIHLEPYEYSVVNGAPVLNGSLTAPPVNRYARAWGMGEPPWPPTAQPWMYVVDGTGIVRAKYTGIMGSDDVNVILAMLSEAGTAR